jgi:hypothetical protein
MNERPRLTMRTNTIRTNRRELITRFKEMQWICSPTKFSPHGIRFA